MPLYEFLVFVLGGNYWLMCVAGMLLLTAEAYLLNRLVIKLEIMNTNTFMTGSVYVIFMSCSSLVTTLHPVLCSSLFLIIALQRLFETYRKETAFSEVFDAGLFIALAVLFYLPALVFAIIIWLCLIIIRPFVWREWIISVFGFLVPWLFVAMYYYWIGNFESFIHDHLVLSFNFRNVDLDWPLTDYLLFAIMFLLALVSLTRVFRGTVYSTVRARNNMLLLLWMAALSLVSVLAAPKISIEYFAFLAIPCAVITSNYLLSVKRIFAAELILTILLMLIIAGQLVDIKLF